MRRDTTVLNWMMVPLAAGLVLLLVLTLIRVRSADEVDMGRGGLGALPAPHPAPDQTLQFFNWASSVAWTPLTNSQNPFFTLAIQPPPPPKPPPPPPKTRKLEVTYRGYMETAAGVRRAVVQVADKQVLGSRGELIVADFKAVQIELRSLVVTNAAGVSNRFEFAKTQSIEVSTP
ncbi:MAG: hypothetical protein IT580_19475 [Verrucomicrobiales bacterium]|nr:hypothetical protein [Verrucomicrobiales bacterium]